MDCFSSDGFDSKCFGQFARNFLRQNNERCQAEFDNVNKEKVKIVSVLAQNNYIMCTLTKDQIKNITAFWQAMIPLIAPESEQVANKIHVSYSGCVREAQRKKRHD